MKRKKKQIVFEQVFSVDEIPTSPQVLIDFLNAKIKLVSEGLRDSAAISILPVGEEVCVRIECDVPSSHLGRVVEDQRYACRRQRSASIMNNVLAKYAEKERQLLASEKQNDELKRLVSMRDAELCFLKWKNLVAGEKEGDLEYWKRIYKTLDEENDRVCEELDAANEKISMLEKANILLSLSDDRSRAELSGAKGKYRLLETGEHYLIYHRAGGFCLGQMELSRKRKS